MKKISVYLTVLLTVLISACGKKTDTTNPVRKDIVQAVYASGKLFPVNHYSVLSKFPGYIQQIHVRAGQVVKTGDLLLTIRNDISKLNTGTAKNQFLLAKENTDPSGSLLNGYHQEVATADSKFKLDSLNFNRFSELLKQNAISKQSFDQAKTQFEISRQNLVRANENYENTERRLQIELKNAENLLQAQESSEKDYKILSVMNGKVYDVIPQIGDLVSSQSLLMEVGDSSNFEVELSVDETDISFIKSEQKVVYSIDAYQGKTFQGTVIELFPKVNQASKTSRVKGSFEYASGLPLYSGMSVEANIIIKEKKNALVIPKDYLYSEDSVQVKGKSGLTKVQTGIQDLEFTEIIDGISEGDVLIKK